MVKVVLINKYIVLKLQENKVESLEADFEQSQSDLRLAFKRISDLPGSHGGWNGFWSGFWIRQVITKKSWWTNHLENLYCQNSITVNELFLVCSEGEFRGDSDTDSSLDMPAYLVNHRSSGSSRRTTGNFGRSSTSSGDTSLQTKHTSNGHDSSLVSQSGVYS